VDFLEATCDEKKNFGPQEIIEFPSVIIDTRTFQVRSKKFDIYFGLLFKYLKKSIINA
jgi:hypothetical protein